MSYALKKRWRDGTTHVVMRPEVLVERLLAVPRPRRHLVTYHGVLAPAAGLRSRVVPRWEEAEQALLGGERVELAADFDEDAGSTAVAALRRRRRRTVPHAPSGRSGGNRARRYAWAELLRRVFAVEVLVCPHCAGPRRVLAAITAPESIETVLRAMGLVAAAPQLSLAPRPPPGDAVDRGGD